MSAPTYLGQSDDDLAPRPRHATEVLPPLHPPVVDEQPAPAPLPPSPAPARPRPPVGRTPRPPREGVRPDVLALLLALAVVVAVTLLALKNVDVPEVLATIGLVAVGVGAGTAIPTSRRQQ